MIYYKVLLGGEEEDRQFASLFLTFKWILIV